MMKTVFSADKTAVKIFGNFSTQPVIAKRKLLGLFENADECFHQIKRLANKNVLPYTGSESHPLSVRAYNYALENEQRGFKFYQWGTKTQGSWYFTGYYYEDDGFYVFPDHDVRIV